MAINKESPYIWTPGMIDMIADLTGQQFIPLFKRDCWKFERNGYAYVDEEWVIEQCLEMAVAKLRLRMPEDVEDKIYEHAALDPYFKELYEQVGDWKAFESNESDLPYRTDSQRLAEVGMSQSDFI